MKPRGGGGDGEVRRRGAIDPDGCGGARQRLDFHQVQNARKVRRGEARTGGEVILCGDSVGRATLLWTLNRLTQDHAPDLFGGYIRRASRQDLKIALIATVLGGRLRLGSGVERDAQMRQ